MADITITKITSPQDMEKCFHIRTVVFVDEQNVPLEEEMDGLDNEAEHYLLFVDGTACGTARVRLLDGVAKIERVAVLRNRRGHDIGRRLMDFIMEDISTNPDIHTLKLGAQIQVVGFYEKLGFSGYGDEFIDAGIRHRWMKRAVQAG